MSISNQLEMLLILFSQWRQEIYCAALLRGLDKSLSLPRDGASIWSSVCSVTCQANEFLTCLVLCSGLRGQPSRGSGHLGVDIGVSRLLAVELPVDDPECRRSQLLVEIIDRKLDASDSMDKSIRTTSFYDRSNNDQLLAYGGCVLGTKDGRNNYKYIHVYSQGLETESTLVSLQDNACGGGRL